jgi:hypothetical protein
MREGMSPLDKQLSNAIEMYEDLSRKEQKYSFEHT